MLEQAFTQMREISVGIALGCDSFVDLNDMHVLPRQIFLCQVAKHHPWCFAPTDCHDKFAASQNRVLRFLGDELGGFAGDGVSIGIDVDIHHAASLATASGFLSSGSLQPSGGVTRATSSGPQVFGPYG